MSRIRVFVDSDVVVSSLLSSRGAAYLLLAGPHSYYRLYISDVSAAEITTVGRRLHIPTDKIKRFLSSRFRKVILKRTDQNIQGRYRSCVKDVDDAHIVAGAVKTGARFLLTYNRKDYCVETVKRRYRIMIFTPAEFLQYLRALN